MRKLVIAVFVLALVSGGFSAAAYAMDCGKDNVIDQAGDWFATLGKEGAAKDQILVKRKADRFSACAKKQADEAAKTAQKAGEDMKKKLGF